MCCMTSFSSCMALKLFSDATLSTSSRGIAMKAKPKLVRMTFTPCALSSSSVTPSLSFAMARTLDAGTPTSCFILRNPFAKANAEGFFCSKRSLRNVAWLDRSSLD